MKIAFILFEDMTALDFVGVYDPLTRLQSMHLLPGVSWELCARTPQVTDGSGLQMAATQVAQPLQGFDLLVAPGGPGTRRLMHDPDFIDWLRSAAGVPLKASVCTGALLLGAAGFLEGRPAATHASAGELLAPYCERVLNERIVDAGDVITAGGVTAGIDLGLHLVERLAGAAARDAVKAQIEYTAPPASAAPAQASGEPLPASRLPSARQARVERKTSETQVLVELAVDGSGRHRLETGIGFLDHMLAHIAVHGMFDLQVSCRGDLHVDMHHSVEDVALALGEAFHKALGERRGLARMGSAYAPMDETLAHAAVDLSGRPYAVVQVEWRDPSVGGVPTSLFEHFFESFAAAARCNLHARALYGRDDHHKAEALFKALARALDAACQLDPRRQQLVPSTKGVLV
jgi:imidazoleglycerol-phosphate dehydratase